MNARAMTVIATVHLASSYASSRLFMPQLLADEARPVGWCGQAPANCQPGPVEQSRRAKGADDVTAI